MKKSISPCLETILYENGKIEHLKYHQKRFDISRKTLFGGKHKIRLDECIDFTKEGKLKIRVIYNEDILRVEYQKVAYRKYKSFCLVENDLVYDFKYEERKEIDLLKTKFTQFDDIIIYSDGFLKDTSIANIAIKLKDTWYTPKKPLLRGTTRQRLIDSGFLKKADLDIDDLRKSSNFAIMNAIIGFKEVDKGVFNVA